MASRRNELVFNFIFPNISINIHGMEQSVKAWRVGVSEVFVWVGSGERTHADPAEVLHTTGAGHLVTAV